eukprot:gene7392-15090_t
MDIVIGEHSGEIITTSTNPAVVQQVICDFDISSYISRYEGWTKLDRLLFIAEKSSNNSDAYNLLINELKKGINVTMYQKVSATVAGLFAEIPETNHDWAEATDIKNISRLEKLEAELISAKNSMAKESIRTAYNHLGEFHYERGNLKEAMKAFLRTKDYCSHPGHSAEMVLNSIIISIHEGNYRLIAPYAAMVEIQQDNVDPIIRSKIKLATALVSLHDEEFKIAAKKFLDIDSELGNQFNQIISGEDIAIYGTLLSLASIERKELRKLLLENNKFKPYFEYVPNVRILANDFINGNYSNVFKYLEQIKNQLLLDIHLYKYIDTLYATITDKVIIQYFSVYDAVDLRQMSIKLGMESSILIEKLSKLISNDLLSARIDSQTQTLHRRLHNDRHVTVEKVLHMSNQSVRDVRRALLRLSLMQHGFSISHKEATGQQGQGQGQQSQQQQSSNTSSATTSVGGGHPHSARIISMSSPMERGGGSGGGGGGGGGGGSGGSHILSPQEGDFSSSSSSNNNITNRMMLSTSSARPYPDRSYLDPNEEPEDDTEMNIDDDD